MNKKNIVIGIGTLILTIVIIILIVNKPKEKIDIDKFPNIDGKENIVEKDNGVKENKSSKFKEEKAYGNYKISNAKLIYENGKTIFKADIKNVSRGALEGHLVDIVLFNKNKEEVSKISTYIRSLKDGEVMEINASISRDVVNAYDYKINKK